MMRAMVKSSKSMYLTNFFYSQFVQLLLVLHDLLDFQENVLIEGEKGDFFIIF